MSEKKKYKCLLFDWDGTLWDVYANQRSALRFVYEQYDLSRFVPDFEPFCDRYTAINDRMWRQYRGGEIEREHLRNHRFVRLFEDFGITGIPIGPIADRYMTIAPTFPQTMPFAHELIGKLKDRYPLYIATNGFNEAQYRKIEHCGMGGIFRSVITSEDAGAKKPDARFFQYALDVCEANPEDVLMIGDDPEADIEGAAGVGIDTAFLDLRNESCRIEPTFTIRCLRELEPILLT